MSFRSLTLDRRYDTYVNPYQLIEEFYQPILAEANQYYRIAGYFSASALTAAADGIEAFAQSGGEMRLLVGVVDRKTREQILQGKPVTLSDRPMDDEARLRQWILGYLLQEGRLQIKVAIPSRGGGIFHAKLGCLRDSEDNTLTFEGSLNETAGGWIANYERFKVHRSWREVEAEYVEQDLADFETLWNDESPAVDVYELAEATEKQIADWSGDDTIGDETPDGIKECVERLETAYQKRDEQIAKAGILRNGRKMPGALAFGDATSTLESIWPHQRVIADTLINAYPRRFLLCDEVGLGKTIEAGVTASRLVKGGIADYGLILPRAGLEKQWQNELIEKFTLNSFTYHRRGDTVVFEDAFGHTDEYPFESEHGAVWSFLQDRDEPTIVIMSWHTARLASHRDEIVMPPATREADPSEMDATESAFGIWDFAIIDEVHSARPDTEFLDLLSSTNGYDSSGLVDCVQGLYLLTATPLQVDLRELHRLVSLLDVPEAWTDEDDFVAFFRWKQEMEDALEEGVADVPSLLEVIEPNADRQILSRILFDIISPLCRSMASEIEGYETTVDDYADRIDSNSSTFRELFSAEYQMIRSRPSGRKLTLPLIEATLAMVEFATPIETRLFRNTRQTLDVYTEANLLNATVADRNVETVSVEVTPAIEDAFDAIETYVREEFNQSSSLRGNQRQAIGFVLTTYRKRLASSVQALRETVAGRKDTVGEKLQAARTYTPTVSTDKQIEDAVVVERLDGKDYREVLQRELEYLDEIQKVLGKVRGADPKLQRLQEDIETDLIESHGRFIVFSQYTDTMVAIRDFLHENGYSGRVGTYSSGGGQRYDAETDQWRGVSHGDIKRAFKSDDDSIDILVCTDSASEGLNLQECGALINFDCPWNPTRIEQRIGRIDRIGQRHDPIEVRNYIYEGTVEEDVYQALDERKQLFESAVGEMQDILDTAASEIRKRIRDEPVSEGVVDATPSASPLRDELEGTAGTAQTPTEVIEAAQKPLSIAHSHPSIGTIGESDTIAPPYDPSIAASLLLDSQFLSSLEVECEPLGDNRYRLQWETTDNPLPADEQVAVLTIDSEQARTEGTRLLTIGDPVFEWLRKQYVARYPEAHKSFIDGTTLRTIQKDIDGEPVRLDADDGLTIAETTPRWIRSYREWKS